MLLIIFRYTRTIIYTWVAASLSAEASPVEAAQAHAVGDVGHRGGWRGARKRAGGVHGSVGHRGWMARSLVSQEGVVRRERIPEEGVRVGAIAVGGGEGRRYREAGTDPLLRYNYVLCSCNYILVQSIIQII